VLVGRHNPMKQEDAAGFDGVMYRWTSLYARNRDSKNSLAYNEFAYKKTKDYCKLEGRFQKKAIFQFYICKIAEKRPHIIRAACT